MVPEQAPPDSRSKQSMANVCKVDGRRQQSQEAAWAGTIRRGQEAKAVMVSVLIYKPVSSEEIRL